MIDRRDVGSWLDGPRTPGPEQRWPGERLGLPQSGPGSVARPGRRVAALAIDWLLCLLIAQNLLGGDPLTPLLVLLAENVLLVGTAGSTVGHAALGLRVVRRGGGSPGPVKALVRSLLLVLVVPAVVWDRDQRGLHDKAADTLVVRR